MIVYRFDYESGGYVGSHSLSVADCDPRAPGVVLIPGDTTVVPPPRCGAGLWPFWRDGQWTVCEEILLAALVSAEATDRAMIESDRFFTEFDN